MTAPRRPNTGFVPERLLGHLVGGAFKLLRVVGTGGTATVFEAQELGTARRCAVKVLHPNPGDASAGPRFVREGEIAQRLMGPHSVEIIRAGKVEGGQPFLVMEFLEGEDLAARLEQRGHLPPDEVVAFVKACAEVLARAHTAGIVHRDLKPANVFYAKRPTGDEIKLLDFGAAKDNQRDDCLTAAGQVVGTPWYMSPEQARGQALDARSDVFSLAIIAFQALSGRVPFDAPRPTDVLFKIVQDPLPPLKDVPADLQQAAEPVLQKALAKKAAERYPNVRDFAEGLSAALAPWASVAKSTISVNLGEAAPVARIETADDELAMVLSAHNLVTEAQLQKALALAKKEGGDLADALLRLGMLPEMKLLSVMPMPAHWRPAPSERIRVTLPPPPVLAMVGVDLATRLRVLPFGWTPIKGELRVFVAFPAVPNLELELKKATKAQKVAVYVTSPGAVHAAIRRWYYDDSTAFTELLPSGAGPRSPVPSKVGPAPSSSESGPVPRPPSLASGPARGAQPPTAPPAVPRAASPVPQPVAAGSVGPAAPVQQPNPVPATAVPSLAASSPSAPSPAPAPPLGIPAEWKPAPSSRPPVPKPRPVPGPLPSTGEFEMVPSEGEWLPEAAPAAEASANLEPPPLEGEVIEEDAQAPETSAKSSEPAPVLPETVRRVPTAPVETSSVVLGAATAAYPVVNDLPVVPDIREAAPPAPFSSPEPESAALSAATAAYPAVPDPPVASELAVARATPPEVVPAEAAASPLVTTSAPIAASEPSASPPEPSGALGAMTGSFSIVVDEEMEHSAAPVAPEPGLPSPGVASPPLAEQASAPVQPAPEADDFALDVHLEVGTVPPSPPPDPALLQEAESDPVEPRSPPPPPSEREGQELAQEADADIEFEDEPSEMNQEARPATVASPAEFPREPPVSVQPEPSSAAPSRPPPPPAEQSEPSLPPPLEVGPPPPPPEEDLAEEVDAAGAEEVGASEAGEPAESFAVEVDESEALPPAVSPIVEPGVGGVRITSDVESASSGSLPTEPEHSPNEVPVARRPTQQDVPQLNGDLESREVELGELMRLQVAPVADDRQDSPDGEEAVAEAPDPRHVLAAPDLVRQALGRIAEVAGADRVALALVGGDAWTDPSGMPPLFKPGWLESVLGSPNHLTILSFPDASVAEIPWFEGATAAAVLSLEIPEVGPGALVFSARQRPTPFAPEDLPVFGALARQLVRVFSVAKSPGRDRLDLEAWLAGERHLGSLADRGSEDGLEVRSRDAVVLCVDARPLLGTLSDLGPVSVLERMNQLVEDVSRAVYAHGGLLERVQGDGVVAVWGALADGSDTWAASEALCVAEVLWTSSKNQQGPPGSGVRVGLHAGRVSVGPVGLKGRKSLSLVGVASALAFRLGSLGEGCPVASVEVLKRAGWVGPGGVDPRARQVDSGGLGVDAFAVESS